MIKAGSQCLGTGMTGEGGTGMTGEGSGMTPPTTVIPLLVSGI
ncbi:MAG: hypothetical protein ACEY3M_19620 [Wolbachia sp.]